MAVRASRLGDGVLQIGETGDRRELGAQVTQIRLTPSSSKEDDETTLDGSILAGAEDTTWELSGEIFQSYQEGSLDAWLFNNQSEQMPFVFKPNKAEETEYSGVLTVRAVEVGGTVKMQNKTEFTFPVVGQPILKNGVI